MKPRKPKWQKQTFKLPDNIDLPVKPGFNVFIADRGAVGFCYPHDWLVIPGKGSIGLHDRKPPKDDCALHVSVMHLPPVRGGWSQLPLSKLVHEMVRTDRRNVTLLGEIRDEPRLDFELCWAEMRFTDPKEKRQARSRGAIARANLVQPLITMDFWESDLEKFGPVWDEVLATLRVGLELPGPPEVGMN